MERGQPSAVPLHPHVQRGNATFTIDRTGPPPDLAADRQVVERVLGGDRDAFRTLVDREGPAIVRACHRILGDLHEAEDASQEAFVTAFRALGTWRQDGPVRRLVDPDRRPRGDPPVTAAPVRDLARPDEPRQRRRRRAATDPATVTLRSERANDVRRRSPGSTSRIARSSRCASSATCRSSEIADQTGRPLGTVKTHLHRGLLRLRASLEGGVA